MPISTMEIDKRPVLAFSGNYSPDANWDAMPFFNMLRGDLLFDPLSNKLIWDGITPFKVRLATPAEAQIWIASRVAEGRKAAIVPADHDDWAAYLAPVRSR